MSGRVVRYVGVATAVTVAAGAIGLPWIRGRFPDGESWGFAGWAAASIVGVATGAWLARVHGRPGSGFLMAIVAGMLVRLVLVGVGLVAALRVGEGPAWGFLSGFAIAFVPLQGYEVVWSLTADRATAGRPAVQDRGRHT